MDTNYTIHELIKGCLQEKTHCQRALVEQYSRMLYAICYRYLNEGETAKDSVQDSFIRIFQKLKTYDSALGSFESWATTIAVRICLNKLKKSKLNIIDINHVSTKHCNYEIESRILDKYDAEKLLEFVAELPEGCRAVFNLAAIDGFSHKEIGELLDISITASRSRLNRAKNILKEKVIALQNKELWVNTK